MSNQIIIFVFKSHVCYEYRLINVVVSYKGRKLKRISYTALKTPAIHSTDHKMERILFQDLPTCLHKKCIYINISYVHKIFLVHTKISFM